MIKKAKTTNALHDLIALTLLAPHVALSKILWRPGVTREGWHISKIEHHRTVSVELSEPAWMINIRCDEYHHIVYTIAVTGGDIIRWLDKVRKSAKEKQSEQ